MVQFVTPEEGCLFSYSLGTAMYVLCILGRAGVSPGLKHGLAGDPGKGQVGRGRCEGRRRCSVLEGSQSTFT